MIFEVIMVEAARADLAERHAYIRGEAGDAVADRYVERVDQRLRKLDRFPRRGSHRLDFGDDILALSFERRLLIIYRVDGSTVHVLRIIGAERDLTDLTL